MSSPDPNWPRWIFASASKHFLEAVPTVTWFVEGQERRTADSAEFAEYRQDGPRCVEISKDYWRLWVAINILVQYTENPKNIHEKWRLTGLVTSGFASCIPVYKYGDGVDDDRTSLLGHLSLVTNRKDPIRPNHMGRIDKALLLEQVTIEAHYELFLRTGAS